MAAGPQRPSRRRLRDVAAKRNVSQSQFVADLITRATEPGWPEEVLALAGSIQDFPGAEELREGMAPACARVHA